MPSVAWFLQWSKSGDRSVERTEGWLRWSAHPFGGAVCRGHAQPCSSPFTSEAAIHFCVFCVSLFITAQTAQCLQIFLVCYRLFVFCFQGDICPGAKCKHSSIGTQALACLSLKGSCGVCNKGATESKVKPIPGPTASLSSPGTSFWIL